MSSQEIIAAWVDRADKLASSTRQAIANEAHLLRVMLDGERLRSVLERCEVDVGRFVKTLDDLVDAQPRRSWLRGPGMRTHAYAALHADSASTDLVDEILFVRALESKVVAPVLEKLVEDTAFTHVFDDDECTDEDAILVRSLPLRVKLVASHGAWREPPIPRGATTIVVHDDPFTTMEFVTQTLHEVFAMSDEDARGTMMRVHLAKRARLDAIEPAKAIARVRAATARARAEGFPLRFTIEHDEI